MAGIDATQKFLAASKAPRLAKRRNQAMLAAKVAILDVVTNAIPYKAIGASESKESKDTPTVSTSGVPTPVIPAEVVPRVATPEIPCDKLASVVRELFHPDAWETEKRINGGANIGDTKAWTKPELLPKIIALQAPN